MKLAWIVAAAAALRPGMARAEPADATNWMIGPLLGLRLGGADDVRRSILGVEGGGGWGPERLNVGVTRRLGKTFTYVELAPWYVAGLSLGAGIDSDGKTHPVIGVWEGLPLRYPACGDDGWQPVITLSAGYRYTGVHELYVAPKVGTIYGGGICIH
jgi:hypothetical protein